MNEIIKNIESAQLKAEVPQFRVGDTVRVHALCVYSSCVSYAELRRWSSVTLCVLRTSSIIKERKK